MRRSTLTPRPSVYDKRYGVLAYSEQVGYFSLSSKSIGVHFSYLLGIVSRYLGLTLSVNWIAFNHSPSLTLTNCPDASARYIKPLSQVFVEELSSCVKLTNFSNLFPAKLFTTMLVSWLEWMVNKCALLYGVLGIVFNRANPKMFRIYARRVISSWAVVKNVKPLWNWPYIYYPASSVSEKGGLSNFIPQYSISANGHPLSPQPTRIGFVYFSPKTGNKASRYSLRMKVLVGKFSHSSVFAGSGYRPNRHFSLCESAGQNQGVSRES